MFWNLIRALVIFGACVPVTVQAQDTVYAGQFSAANSTDPLPPDWKPITFEKIPSHTRYSLVNDAGTTVVKAESRASASGLMRKMKIDPKNYPIIRWRWKAVNILKKGDAAKKQGDDYAARIYITFEYDPEKTDAFEKFMHQLAKFAYGEHSPASAVNYIWANKTPVGTILQNPYTKLNRMIVVQSGEESLKTWIDEERNIVDDYVAAFGKQPPMISGIAIMTDSDNTKESATAFYGDIRFQRK